MKKHKILFTLLSSAITLFTLSCSSVKPDLPKPPKEPEINENKEENSPNKDSESEPQNPVEPDNSNISTPENDDSEVDKKPINPDTESPDQETLPPVIPEIEDNNQNNEPEKEEIEKEPTPEIPSNPDLEDKIEPDETEKDPTVDIETELRKIDPFYPIDFDDRPYKFIAQPLKDRLTINENGKTATFFAPNVSKTSGFYDANKNFVNDISLCWAASCSNLIAWYLDQYKANGYDLTGLDTEIYSIFDHFRQNWEPRQGYDPLQGLAWYFTGNTLTGGKPDELINENSGGYLKSLPHVGDLWSILDPFNHYQIVGNYSEKYPFVDDNLTINGTHLNFSKQIITQLHYGPTSITVTKPNTGVSTSHALTLWGCEYDINTGLINKVYITDSDDEIKYPGKHLSEIKVRGVQEPDGIEINYYIAGDVVFKRITTSTLLFHPNTVIK